MQTWATSHLDVNVGVSSLAHAALKMPPMVSSNGNSQASTAGCAAVAVLLRVAKRLSGHHVSLQPVI
jgi:hypothetical protein